MKKRITSLAVVLLMLLAVSAASAAASPYDLDGQFISGVQRALSRKVNWNRTVSDDGTFVTINETAVINGSKCEFDVIGYRDRAYQVCLTVPYSKLTIDLNGIFSDPLFVYNEFYYLVMEQYPKNSVPFEIFSPYDIQYALKNGYRDYSSILSDGWEWLRKESGYLKMQRKTYPNSWMFSGHLLDTGDVWFNAEYR